MEDSSGSLLIHPLHMVTILILSPVVLPYSYKLQHYAQRPGRPWKGQNQHFGIPWLQFSFGHFSWDLKFQSHGCYSQIYAWSSYLPPFLSSLWVPGPTKQHFQSLYWLQTCTKSLSRVARKHLVCLCLAVLPFQQIY